MHRLIVLASLFITMSCGAVDLLVTNTHPKLAAHMQDACLLSGTDCTGLEVPTLLFDDTGRSLGFYPMGSRVVFVSNGCLLGTADQTKCEAVLVHELVHYVLWFKGNVKDACESEARAWDVYNAYVMDRKRLDLVRENWQESYPQCAKSPSSSTSSVTP